MNISHIAIRNFRGIEKIDLPIKPGVNILLGDNGVGKTTILEALTIALGGYLQGIQNIKVGGFQQDDFRYSILKVGGASSQIKYYSPEITFQLNVDGKVLSDSRSRNNRDGNGRTITKCLEIQKYAQDIANDENAILPILSYMSISRVTMSKRADYGKKVKNQLNDRRCGYIGCMDSVIDKSNILEWLKKISYEAVLQEKEMPELKLFYNIVSTIMREVNELEENPVIRYSSEFDNIAYSENGKPQNASNLSAGYQSLLWMIMDFAFRLAILNPGMKDSSEATGIILIDEIDMHLHPKWQWNILNALKKTFPNVQFIVATHSPIIISSCEHANLIQLDEEHNVKVLKNAYAYPVDSVLELIDEN